MGSEWAAFGMAAAALLTGSAAIWQQRRGSLTDGSSVASQLTAAASGLVKDLRDEIRILRGLIADLQNLVAALESEIVTLGGDPTRIRLEVNALRRATDFPDVSGTPI